MNNMLTTCKACGAEIAKNAKACPHCGSPNKKPIYKKWWFWLIVLFILCSSCSNVSEGTSSHNTQKPLPVKFGSVTNVETIGEDAELIVLSMNEPSSSKGAERDVYISAVDYIFTHASRNLKSLYVDAYDQQGKGIISFTMPSYLITALRDSEAQGSWGTQGFAAFFYMNKDAYDVLVSSCIVRNK